jgi:uncharacterized protein YndB with AHSA1/START domain
MQRVLKYLVLGTALLALALLGLGFALPDTARISRNTEIQAPPETVFALLNGFSRFNEWSPWAQLDPGTRYRIEGPESGEGARHLWESDNPSVGSGSQEIIESQPPQRIVIQLIFSGFDSDNLSIYELEPLAGGQATRLHWIYETDVKGNLMGRYFLLALDGLIGANYERGLARLKALLESPPG